MSFDASVRALPVELRAVCGQFALGRVHGPHEDWFSVVAYVCDGERRVILFCPPRNGWLG